MKKLGFGCMRLPQKDNRIDMDTFTQMVDDFMKKGFTYFDTSYVYHNVDSEKALREVLVNRYPRDSFTITTKSPVFMIGSREQFRDIFNEQLERLGTDFVDYYWLHAVNRDGYEKIQKLDLVSALTELKNEGKTRHIGISYHDSPELLDQILTDHPELEYVQLQLNYFDWDSPYVASGACYEVCKKHGKPVVVMEPIKGGALINLPDNLKTDLEQARPDMDMAEWAIRYTASPDYVFMVLSGMSDMAQMEDNTSFMKDFRPLDDEESALITKTAASMRSDMAYDPKDFVEAEKVCPKNIGIVKIVEMLDDHKKMNGFTNTCVYYDTFLGEAGKAKDCDACGKCLPVANGNDVVSILKEADDTITHF